MNGGAIEHIEERVAVLEEDKRTFDAERGALVAQLQEMSRRMTAAISEMSRVTGELAGATAKLSEHERKLDDILEAITKRGDLPP